MTPNTKHRLMAVASVTAIIIACLWIYFTQVRAVGHQVGLHQRVGEVMAEETASLVGSQGKIVTIAIETRDWPELKTQLAAFKATLKKLGNYEIREYELDTKDQPKYGVGSGLSGRRYVRTVLKNEHASVFVSFVGAPDLTAEEMAQLEQRKPKLIAESRSPYALPDLFTKGLLQVAVVSRFQFPSPGTDQPKTPEEWFTKRYQVVRPGMLRILPQAQPE